MEEKKNVIKYSAMSDAYALCHFGKAQENLISRNLIWIIPQNGFTMNLELATQTDAERENKFRIEIFGRKKNFSIEMKTTNGFL